MISNLVLAVGLTSKCQQDLILGQMLFVNGIILSHVSHKKKHDFGKNLTSEMDRDKHPNNKSPHTILCQNFKEAGSGTRQE